jgi:hypothetical protein
MNEIEIGAVLVDLLARIEPDVRGATFSIDADLKTELHLDEDDLERFALAVAKTFGLHLGADHRRTLQSLASAIALVKEERRAGAELSAILNAVG